jgi:8-oxo-dGTP diphosphatase
MPHIHDEPGQYDHAVEVFVVCEGKVLIRKHEKYHLWIGVGGHIELDEDPNQAAIREVREEVGLDVKLWSPVQLPTAGGDDIELVPPVFLNRHPINDSHSHIANVYFATSPNRDVIPEFKNDEWRWLSRDEVEKNQLGMKPNIRHYALVALDVLGNEDKAGQRPKVGIGVIVERKGKILVGRRLSSHGSGTWEIPGGHLEFGESFEQAAEREVREETGLQRIEAKAVVSLNNDIAYDKHYVSIGVLVTSEMGEPTNPEPEHSTDWHWCDPNKLPEPFFPHSRNVVNHWLGQQT